jgi:NADH:ubiquinone oxidoreductase subunit E
MSEVALSDPEVGSAEFTPEQWERIDAVIGHHQGKPGALIPVLEQVQGISGYLPESVQRRVAAGLDLPLSQVYGVVTFYSFFTMRPRGRHKISVCLGTACHVAGATQVLAAMQQQLDCEPGEMSADRVFSLEVVRCLGACGLAPVVKVDDHTHSGVRPSQVCEILRHYRSQDAKAAIAQQPATLAVKE